jgi:D-proline reductase (dithiol) PrdB
MGISRWKNRLLARLFSAFPRLAERWGRRLERRGDEIPWHPPARPLRQSRLALITTGGVHLRSQAPFDMRDPDGDPSLRAIPIETALAELAITHDYYEHRDAERDLNLVLPIERLAELASRGVLGAVHSPAYSLMGHIDGRHVRTLVEETAPRIASEIAGAGADIALLVPA